MPAALTARGAAVAAAAGRRVTPLVAAVIASLTAAVFCLVRLVHLGGGAGTFVVAGQPYTDPAGVPGNVPVLAQGGFDGQFFYRLALDPRHVGMGRVHGIMFDYGVRGGRIAYPLLAWAGSLGGRQGLVPTALIVVNVVAIGVLAWIGAQLAIDHGRAPLWGLALAGYWGFAIVLARDLSELVAAVGVFGMLLLVGRGRYRWAGVLGVLAVSTREQAVLTVAAITIGVVWSLRRDGWPRALRAGAEVAVLPAVAFLAWQAVVAHVIGEFPATSSSRFNSAVPFSAFPGAIRTWFRDAGDALTPSGGMSLGLLLPLVCFVALMGLLGLAVTSDGFRLAWAQRPWEVLAGAAAVGVLSSSATNVLTVPADFRQSSEVAGCAWLVVWGAGPSRRRWALLVVVPVTVVVVGFRCLVR